MEQSLQLPSLFVASIYIFLKVLGNVGFGFLLNHSMNTKLSPWKFGLAQTAIGLGIGVAFLVLFIPPRVDVETLSGMEFYLASVPVRMLAWAVTVDLFLGFKERQLEHTGAVLVGTAWSFGMDWLMDSAGVLPAVQMEFF